jgi:hypothetical protein
LVEETGHARDEVVNAILGETTPPAEFADDVRDD